MHVIPSPLDPSNFKHRHICIELYNGTVAVTKELAARLGARPRPQPPVSIREDECGASAGSNYGSFGYAIAHPEIVSRWGSEAAFAAHVVRLVKQIATGKENENVRKNHET